MTEAEKKIFAARTYQWKQGAPYLQTRYAPACIW